METNKTYAVVISKRATQMLVSHAAFLAKVSREAADRLVTSFETAANSLAVMPERCAWLNADGLPHNKYRKIPFEKRYLLLFQIRDRTVYVDFGCGLPTGLWLAAQVKKGNIIMKDIVFHGVLFC